MIIKSNKRENEKLDQSKPKKLRPFSHSLHRRTATVCYENESPVTPIRVKTNINKRINIKCFLDDSKTITQEKEKNHTPVQKIRGVSDVRIKNKSLQTQELKKLISRGQSSEWDTVKT